MKGRKVPVGTIGIAVAFAGGQWGESVLVKDEAVAHDRKADGKWVPICNLEVVAA